MYFLLINLNINKNDTTSPTKFLKYPTQLIFTAFCAGHGNVSSRLAVNSYHRAFLIKSGLIKLNYYTWKLIVFILFPLRTTVCNLARLANCPVANCSILQKYKDDNIQKVHKKFTKKGTMVFLSTKALGWAVIKVKE